MKKFLEKAVANINFEAERLIDHFIKVGHFPEKLSHDTQEMMRHEINEYKESFFRGYDIILDYAERGQLTAPKENFELKAIDKKKHPEYAHANTNKVIKSKFLQEIFNYSPRMMRDIYEVGCHFYHSKEFNKCLDICTFLNVLNPSICSSWQVRGRALEEQEKLREALHAYCVALNCNLHRLEGYRDAVRCCVKLKQYKTAIDLLDYGLDTISAAFDSKELKPLQSDLQAMKSNVQKMGS